MNYIAQINAFQDWAQINSPSTAQVAMWYALMDINNRCAWKEWFSAPYSMIEVRTGISRSGITKTRNALADHGLIEFKNQGGSSAALYKMIPFGSQIVATKVTTNEATNVTSSEIVATNGSAEWPQMGHILKHNSSSNVIDSSPSEIEQYFIDKRNRGFGITTDDYSAIYEVVNHGIPVDFVKSVIDTAFKEYKPKYPRDGITNFTYIAPRIHREWLIKQEKEKGGRPIEKHRGGVEGVRSGGNPPKSNSNEGESKIYPGKWDNAPLPKMSG